MAEDKDAKQEKKVYTYQDLIKFSNLDIYSGFGEVKESIKPSAPKYSFGTSTRDAEPKKFQNKEMAKIDCYGTYLITKASKHPKDPTTMFMINFYTGKGQNLRSAPNPATLLTPKPNTSTISGKISMYLWFYLVRYKLSR